MVGRRGASERGLTRVIAGVVCAFGVALGAFGVIPLGASQAYAQGMECEEGQKPVEREGTIICVDVDEGDDGDGGDGDNGEPAPPPPDGTKRWNERTSICSEDECPRDLWCEDDSPQEPIYYERRREVYRSAEGGWVPVAGEDGEWTWFRTSCEIPEEDLPTEDEVREAIGRFGLPGAEPSIQPPNGRTLVNLDTYFHTEQVGVDPFTVQVGPVDVDVRATARSYEWDFGDGHGTTTEGPGAPYPDGNITHVYEKKGTFEPSVTVRYDVEWRYDGIDWMQMSQPMEATDSPPVDLQVVESKGKLSDHN